MGNRRGINSKRIFNLVGHTHGRCISNDCYRFIKHRYRDLKNRVPLFIHRQIGLIFHLHIIIVRTVPLNTDIRLPVPHQKNCRRKDPRPAAASLQSHIHTVLSVFERGALCAGCRRHHHQAQSQDCQPNPLPHHLSLHSVKCFFVSSEKRESLCRAFPPFVPVFTVKQPLLPVPGLKQSPYGRTRFLWFPAEPGQIPHPARGQGYRNHILLL